MAGRRREARTTCSRCSWPQEVGIDPNDVNFVTYDGGGPLTSALLGKKIDAGFSGLPEFQGSIDSGELRVLAVSGEERYPEGSPFADVPTLTEEGVDLVFLNWRGVLAPPEISDERTEELIGYFEDDARDRRRGSRSWRTTAGPTTSRPARSSATFIEEQDERVSGTLEDLGLL